MYISHPYERLAEKETYVPIKNGTAVGKYHVYITLLRDVWAHTSLARIP